MPRTRLHAALCLTRFDLVQISVIMVLLARLVHWQPALAGVLTTVVLVPITAAITRKAAGVRKRLIGLTDARVKVCTEVVSGVRLDPLCSLDSMVCLHGFNLFAIVALHKLECLVVSSATCVVCSPDVLE